MNDLNHPLDLHAPAGALDLFAEELELAESLQLCTYGCASTVASSSCPFSCASTMSTLSCECCQGS